MLYIICNNRNIEITSKQAMALISAFLLAMGDAGVNNVIYTTVPIVWGDKSLPAYGLFKVSLSEIHCLTIFA